MRAVPICDDDRAELIGQPDPRLQPLQLVGMDRREVHGVPHHAVAQEIADGGRRLEADQFLRLFGRRRDVRRRDRPAAVGRATNRPAAPFRTRRAPAPPTMPLSIARRSAASSISSPRAVLMMRMPGLQRANRVVVEQVLRLRRRRQVQRQVVGRRAQLVERQQLDAEAVGDLLRDERIVRDDAHAERARALRHFLADASEAGDAERLAAQLGAEEPLLLPLAVLHRLIGGRDRCAPAPASARRRARRR